MADPTFEPEVYNAGRCFTNAQEWLALQGLGVVTTYPDITVGWHDTEIDPHKGSFALVQVGSTWETLIGDRIRVTTRSGRSALAYVFGAADVPTELSVAYAVWTRLTFPAERSMAVRVEVLA